MFGRDEQLGGTVHLARVGEGAKAAAGGVRVGGGKGQLEGMLGRAERRQFLRHRPQPFGQGGRLVAEPLVVCHPSLPGGHQRRALPRRPRQTGQAYLGLLLPDSSKRSMTRDATASPQAGPSLPSASRISSRASGS